MWINGKNFSEEIVSQIRAVLNAEPGIKRRELSLRVCEWLDWHYQGQPQEMSCRAALMQLDREGLISLPEVTAKYPFQTPRSEISSEVLEGLPEQVKCGLGQLGQVEVVPVKSRLRRQMWKDMMQMFHPLGGRALCGEQIRYVVESEHFGVLGGLGFGAAIRHSRARDEWIGWSEKARHFNLREVVGNSRFLILPMVEVPNLSSHVLSLTLHRLREDWQERYGHKPVLVETFVDPRRFDGTSYQAANWIQVGQTAARKTPFKNGKVSDGKKDIYLYPLHRNYRAILRQEPETPLGSRPRPSNPADWVEEELGTVEFYNSQRIQRLMILVRDFYKSPGASIPDACDGSQAKTRAAVDFFKNESVTMEAIMKAHAETTVERINALGPCTILAPQDTTSVNFTKNKSMEDVGPINTKKDGSTGLIMHDTLAVTCEGTAMGFLNVQCWARDEEEAGKSENRSKLPIEEKESYKWIESFKAVAEAQKLCPDATLVSICDREGDIYELFLEAKKDPKGPKLIVRADKGRKRTVEDVPLWEFIQKKKIRGNIEVHVPKTESTPERTAQVVVRFAKVTLNPPVHKMHYGPITLWAVYAQEVDYDVDTVTEPLDWMLLTTIKIKSFKAAVQLTKWYAKRWVIEVAHRTIKTGCRIEDRRLKTADRAMACLAIDMVVAARAMYLTQLSREEPTIPCDRFFEEEEWIVLCAYFDGIEAIPETPP